MVGHTLVGEYIGNQDYQHLVKYSRVTLIFYAIVDNNSSSSCWPCTAAWSFFQKYKLDRVHIQSLGEFTDFSLLCDQLEKTFKDVAKSSIADDEEGNVLYFVQLDKDATPEDFTKQNVLSLAKLKTLEYRVFRKMREKLRGFYARQKKAGNIEVQDRQEFNKLVQKFDKECKEFLEGGQNQLPQPLEYYVHVFTRSYDFIQENNNELDNLHNRYVTFSENLLAYIKAKDKDFGGSEKEFFHSNILDI